MYPFIVMHVMGKCIDLFVMWNIIPSCDEITGLRLPVIFVFEAIWSIIVNFNKFNEMKKRTINELKRPFQIKNICINLITIDRKMNNYRAVFDEIFYLSAIFAVFHKVMPDNIPSFLSHMSKPFFAAYQSKKSSESSSSPHSNFFKNTSELILWIFSKLLHIFRYLILLCFVMRSSINKAERITLLTSCTEKLLFILTVKVMLGIQDSVIYICITC